MELTADSRVSVSLNNNLLLLEAFKNLLPTVNDNKLFSFFPAKITGKQVASQLCVYTWMQKNTLYPMANATFTSLNFKFLQLKQCAFDHESPH